MAARQLTRMSQKILRQLLDSRRQEVKIVPTNPCTEQRCQIDNVDRLERTIVAVKVGAVDKAGAPLLVHSNQLDVLVGAEPARCTRKRERTREAR